MSMAILGALNALREEMKALRLKVEALERRVDQLPTIPEPKRAGRPQKVSQ